MRAASSIEYQDTLRGIAEDQLEGPFFEGWLKAPGPATHLRILRGSSQLVLATDAGSDKVIGYITAISDGVLSAYIPLLEVLPGFRERGIGSQLLRRMLLKLERLYMVDVVCDPNLQPFYERHGLQAGLAMIRRNYAALSD